MFYIATLAVSRSNTIECYFMFHNNVQEFLWIKMAAATLDKSWQQALWKWLAVHFGNIITQPLISCDRRSSLSTRQKTEIVYSKQWQVAFDGSW